MARPSLSVGGEARTQSLPGGIKALLAAGLGLVPRGEHGRDLLHRGMLMRCCDAETIAIVVRKMVLKREGASGSRMLAGDDAADKQLVPHCPAS